MKQLLFLLLFPCFAMAQYQGNGNQKITLGEQSTADGLVWRGIRADTTSKIVPFSDTSAYIILDTVEKTLWLYKAGQIPKWQQVGGSTLDTATMLLPYWRSGRFSGVLPVANGGTGASVKIFVDTFSNQIVNGLKTYSNIATFNDSIKVQSIRIGLGNNNISSNFSIGSNNLISNTSGDQNTAVGHNVLRDNTTGGRNAGFGTNALRNNISGNSNMAIGVGSLQNCTDCIGNVAIGRESLELTTTNANDNVAIGYSALYNNTTGDRNVAIGSSAGIGIYPDTKANTTGINNIYIGYQSVGSSSGNTNEIIIGGNAIGNGSNSVTIGNSSITKTILNGNVGIGTASPTPGFQLQVTGSNARFAMLNSSGNTTNYSQMAFGNGGGTGQYAEFYRQNDTKRFHIYNDGGDIGLSARYSAAYIYDIYLNTSGNVGIGTTSPTEKLHVVGNARISGLANAANPVNVQVDVNGVLVRTSSIDIKEDVQSLPYGLNEVMLLQPSKFSYIDKYKYGEGYDIGFIAQDVNNVIPEAVGTGIESDIFMDSVKLIPILTKAIQEQQALIKALEQRILILENK